MSRTQKNVSDFVQKHFVSATNVSQFAQPRKHHGQQCVRNNVPSFIWAFRGLDTTRREQNNSEPDLDQEAVTSETDLMVVLCRSTERKKKILTSPKQNRFEMTNPLF